ncbi:replicative DNA helicase [Sinanaerobacter chloroacetimidivorans]|jgi:replicative DNA helicase|uniref:Replicative DNA helicase n=1 Tax=Sinanaerobacter chloroacetimidivorans TaxID=2818044 RepID=A0A8J7W376_9FIRM|nr:replicative DNA helicase [Sinanaerobacter chloroacetimidivorans]MBR0598338.1 replicative DNA helicase [Sinanaerobacter chloroacetimidivorans]
MSQYERIPPHNDDAEKSVLGSILLDKDALYDVLEILKAEEFYNDMHKEIYQAIIELYRKNEPVDTLTVSEELKKRKTLEMVGGRAYIALLSTIVPSTSNAVQYAKIIGEKAVLRRLINTASDIIEKGYQEKMQSEEVLDYAERGIFEIAQSKQTKDFQILKDVLWSNIAKIDEMSKLEGNITGLTTGFIDLDAKTSGLQKSDLIMLAARPAMGKTAFALNIAQQAAIKGKAKVLIFSLEMSKEQLGQRLLSMESRIEMQKLKTGSLERQDWDQIHIALDTLSKTSIYIDDTPGITAMEIKNKCRRLKAEHGLDLVVIDYLQLMSYEGRSESRQQEISSLSRFLKLLAREMDCPVIVLSQLSRAVEQRTDHRPILSDLRESGSIEQDADIVMFLYRDEYYNPETTEKPNICEVIIAKQRSGPTGNVELTWLGKYTRFVDKSRISDR